MATPNKQAEAVQLQRLSERTPTEKDEDEATVRSYRNKTISVQQK